MTAANKPSPTPTTAAATARVGVLARIAAVAAAVAATARRVSPAISTPRRGHNDELVDEIVGVALNKAAAALLLA